MGWKAKDLGRLVNLKFCWSTVFLHWMRIYCAQLRCLPSYMIWPVIPEIQEAYNWKKCWKWEGQNLQVKASEVKTLWGGKGVTMGFLLFQVQGKGPLWGFFFLWTCNCVPSLCTKDRTCPTVSGVIVRYLRRKYEFAFNSEMKSIKTYLKQPLWLVAMAIWR